MWQYVDANQLSPRVSLTWKPVDGTTFHAGYARNFTPPEQVLAAPTNLALVQGTTAQPGVSQNDPVLPERSNVSMSAWFRRSIGYALPEDLSNLEVGIDGYYKTATDLLDDGQFGQAYVLTAFNYARGENAASNSRRTTPTATSGRMEILPGPSRSPATWCRTSICSQQEAANSTYLSPTTTNLHRSRPDPDRLGRRLLSVLRPVATQWSFR